MPPRLKTDMHPASMWDIFPSLLLWHQLAPGSHEPRKGARSCLWPTTQELTCFQRGRRPGHPLLPAVLFPQRVVIQSVLRRTTKPPCSPNSKQRAAHRQQHPSLPGSAVPCPAPPLPGHAVLRGTPPPTSPTSHHTAAAVRAGTAVEAGRARSQPGGRRPGLDGCTCPLPGRLGCMAGRSQAKNYRPEPAWAGQACFTPILWALPTFKPPSVIKWGKSQGPGDVLPPSWEPVLE